MGHGFAQFIPQRSQRKQRHSQLQTVGPSSVDSLPSTWSEVLIRTAPISCLPGITLFSGICFQWDSSLFEAWREHNFLCPENERTNFGGCRSGPKQTTSTPTETWSLHHVPTSEVTVLLRCYACLQFVEEEGRKTTWAEKEREAERWAHLSPFSVAKRRRPCTFGSPHKTTQSPSANQPVFNDHKSWNAQAWSGECAGFWLE